MTCQHGRNPCFDPNCQISALKKQVQKLLAERKGEGVRTRRAVSDANRIIDTLTESHAELDRIDGIIDRAHEAQQAAQPAPKPLPPATYHCNVANCGNGNCAHQLLDRRCPHCQHALVRVTTNGHVFCSNPSQLACEYEEPAQ